MSRSRRGSKPVGFEYWSKRPGPSAPGRWSKSKTHRIERARAKQAVKSFVVKIDGGG